MFSGGRITLFKVMLIIIGIIMMIFSMGDAVAVWKKDFGKIYDKGIHDYEEDELVTGKIEYVEGIVAEMESSQTIYGIPVKKSITPYYLCYVEHETDELWGYFIIVHATDEDSIKAMKDLMYSPSSNAPIGLEFKTGTIPDEVMDYTIQYMTGADLTEHEAKSLLAPLMLEEADYNNMKLMPLFGFIIALIPTLMFIFSWRKNRAYKSSRTHYVNEASADPYNTAPTTANGAQGAMRRYSADAYEAHTTPGGVPQETIQQPSGRRYDPSAYSGGNTYEPGEMDSIDTSHLNL